MSRCSPPIDFDVDVEGRRGHLKIAGYVEMTGEPIRNKVSGAETRAQIRLPDGFEYEVAEIGSASSRTTRRTDGISRSPTNTPSSRICISRPTVSSTPDLTSRVLRHERLVVGGGVALLVLLCWWLFVLGGAGMNDGAAMAHDAASARSAGDHVVGDDGGDDAAVGRARYPALRTGSRRRAAATAAIAQSLGVRARLSRRVATVLVSRLRLPSGCCIGPSMALWARAGSGQRC